LLLSRMTVPVLFFMMRKRETSRHSVSALHPLLPDETEVSE